MIMQEEDSIHMSDRTMDLEWSWSRNGPVYHHSDIWHNMKLTNSELGLGFYRISLLVADFGYRSLVCIVFVVYFDS